MRFQFNALQYFVFCTAALEEHGGPARCSAGGGTDPATAGHAAALEGRDSPARRSAGGGRGCLHNSFNSKPPPFYSQTQVTRFFFDPIKRYSLRFKLYRSFDLFDTKFDHSFYLKNSCKYS